METLVDLLSVRALHILPPTIIRGVPSEVRLTMRFANLEFKRRLIRPLKPHTHTYPRTITIRKLPVTDQLVNPQVLFQLYYLFVV